MSRKRRQQRATVVTAPAPAPTRGLNVATFASYDGAMPDKTRQLSNRIGTNPNSAYAQQQRVTMMWQAEDLVKNSDWVSFIYSLKQYCQPTGYHAETGDPALDNEVNAYLRETFKRGGINCSAMEAFSAAAHVEMPVRGDSILEWYQDESQMRLIVQCADQIGELYRFINPSSYGEGINDPPFFTSAEYIAGVYLSPVGLHEGYKIYERGYNQTYLNPRNVPAGQCIYFQDNLFVGVRGVTKFAAAIQSIQKRNKTWQSGMDSMALQAKIAAIGRNNSGGEFTYEQNVNDDGSITYQERMESGAVVKWQFPGDEYQFLKNEQPGPALLQGLDYADERTCLSLGFPKSFLISARDGGGAPSRFDANRAGREIMRLRDTVYVPRLDKIAYGFIMDGIRRGKLPAKSGILRGRWHFPPLPSADAFRDDKSDIMAIRAGLTTATAVIAKNGEGTFESVLQRREQEAVAIRVAAWRATQTLKQMGIPGEITADEIAQKTDNPSFESAQPKPQENATERAMMSEFKESDHPRENDGEFAPKGAGGSGSKEGGKVSDKAQKRVDDAIESVHEGYGSITAHHGTSQENPVIHIGQTFADNKDTADRYSDEKTFTGEISMDGLKVARVKTFDTSDANHGAIGDKPEDIEALKKHGIDVLIYDDQDPSGRDHKAYRMVSEKAVKRAKEALTLSDNAPEKLIREAEENWEIDVDKLRGKTASEIYKIAIQEFEDEDSAKELFREAKVQIPKPSQK